MEPGSGQGARQREDTGTVVVRLTGTASGQPIPDAKVPLIQQTLPRPKLFRGVTNASSDSRIEAVAPGSYLVTAQKLGYVYWSRQLQVTVNPGATAEVKMTFEPTAFAGGVVRGEDNEPLAGVSVYAIPKDGQALDGESGADGRYKIDNIPLGSVHFRLTIPSVKMTTRAPGTTLPEESVIRPFRSEIEAMQVVIGRAPPVAAGCAKSTLRKRTPQ